MLDAVSSPWQALEEQTASWLQERGFIPRNIVDPAWTTVEVETLKQAMKDLAAGRAQKPTESMTTLHYLSHHVMLGRHSRDSCRKRLAKLRRRLGDAAAWAVLDDEPVEDQALSDAGSSDSDSEDEVQLYPGRGL